MIFVSKKFRLLHYIIGVYNYMHCIACCSDKPRLGKFFIDVSLPTKLV